MSAVLILVAIFFGLTAKHHQISADVSTCTYYHPFPGLPENILFSNQYYSQTDTASLHQVLHGFKQQSFDSRKSISVTTLLLVLSGDTGISSNPGPIPPKYPCGKCKKAVTNNCKAVKCDHCSFWIHNNCGGTTDSQYENYMENANLTFICPNCYMPTFIRNMSSDIFTTENKFEALSDTNQDSDNDSTLPSIYSPTSFRPAPYASSTPKDTKSLRNIAKNLRIMSVNCNSLQSFDKRADLQALIDKHNPNIILGQESKLGPEHHNSEIFPQGFTVIRKDRKAGGGGVFILIKQDIDYIEGAFNGFKTDCEIAWAQVRLPGSKLLNIASMYRPPNSKIEYMKKLQSHLNQVYSKYRNATYIAGGDMNLSCVDWINQTIDTSQSGSINDASHCSTFLEAMNDLGLSQHSLEITREESQKILDLILTNRPDTISDTKSVPGMSDHNVVLSSFNLAAKRVKIPQRKVYKYNKADWDKIRTCAKQLVTKYFDRNPEKHSVDENCEFIEKGIEEIIEEEIPSKMTKSKQTYPWITPSVKKAQKRRDRLYAKAKKTRSPKLWKKFKEYRQKAKEEIRSSHTSYIQDMIGESLQENPKPFWSYIKSLRKDSNSIPTLQTKSGMPAATDQSKAKALVNQFSSVFTKENIDDIPQIPQQYPDMPDITFGEEGIFKLLNNVNPNKAGGPDHIPARFLKETAREIAPMYSHLFQQSYNQGQLPKSWKHAVVCPIFKKGQKSLPENYRPVSLTAIPCKLMEHIIVSQVWSHLNKHNIITSKQHGFRSGMSCETQLLEALEDWSRIMDKGSSQIDVIVLDFSKAFDMVPHQRLIQKINSYGITGKTQHWINSFLSSRTHQVLVNGSSSDIQPVISGVPQGTVLGPLLFLTYINDIETNLDSTIRLFADDSAIYREIDTIDDSLTLQKDLFKLQEWADKWQMNFNVKKCKTLRITRRTKNRINFTYLMSTPSTPSPGTIVSTQVLQTAKEVLHVKPPNRNFSPLDEITSDRYLGVILDNKLSFNPHVDTITRKATNLLNLCRRNLHMCSPQIKEIAYKSLIRPHLEYASPAWNPHTSRNIDKIEAVQRRAARFVLSNYNYGPDAHLSHQITHQLHWLPLQHRRTVYDLSTFFKIRNDLINIQFPSTVQVSPRHDNRYLHIQSQHSEAYKYHFFTRTIRIWNILPNSIVTASTLNSFKSQTVKWITPLSWQKVNSTWALI